MEETSVRVDKWLWAARFFKTRSKARSAVVGGKVRVNGARARAARLVRVGDELSITRGNFEYEITVDGLSDKRGSAEVAQTLYSEKTESIDRREAEIARRRMERAGLTIPNLRPDKAGRRELIRLKKKAHGD